MNRRLLMAIAAEARGSPPITSSDADVTAWIAAVGQTNTTQAEVDILTAMVAGIKSDLGIASLLSEKFDRFWMYPTAFQAGARVDLVARASHIEVNTPTWTSQKGYAGDGASSYIDTGWVPNNGPRYGLTSAALGLFVQAFDSRAATVSTMGAVIGSTIEVALHKAGNTTQVIWRVNGTGDVTSTVTQGPGLWHEERTGPNAQALYKNGTSVASSALGTGGSAPLFNLFVLALNTSGTPSLWSNATMAVTYAGTSFGATAVGQISTRVQTALHAINPTNFP